MTSSITVLLSCLLLASQGLADMDNNQQIEQMMSKMKAAMMVEVQEKVEEMRDEMREKEVVMEDMRQKMEKGEEMMREEMQEKNNEMKDVKKQLDRLESRNVELTTKLKEVDQKSLRDLPYVLTCAYQDGWYTPGATIIYSRLIADSNNSDKPGGGDGRLDISTGKFTALTAGHYTVTYSGLAEVDPGERVYFQLMKNDQNMGNEGYWQSFSSGSNGGSTYDQGSRTVVSV